MTYVPAEPTPGVRVSAFGADVSLRDTGTGLQTLMTPDDARALAAALTLAAEAADGRFRRPQKRP